MNFIQLKSKSEWAKWDDFVGKTPYTSFLAYSSWLEMYCILPFITRKIGFAIFENDKIMGGITGIIIGWSKLSFVIFPSGPYKCSENSALFDIEDIVVKMLESRPIRNAIRVQFASSQKLDTPLLKIGKKLKLVYLNPGFGLIKLFDEPEAMLTSMKSKVRRDIRSSLNKGLGLVEVKDEAQLKCVYSIFKKNATDGGYRIRQYFLLKKGWLKSISNNQSSFYLVEHDGVFKGAIWIIEAGCMFHYIMGGSSKEISSLNIGYFIQWQMIVKSIKKGYKSYNISLGGSQGVEKFKDDFGREIKAKSYYYYC
jgi:hypothetical protein